MRIRFGLLADASTMVVAVAVMAGCASQPKPTEEITRARTMVETAEQRGAQQYAGVELEQARNKLSAAEAASGSGKQEVARRLAVESSLDAELASAKAGAGQAEHSAAEVDQSLATLRAEANRKTQSPVQ